MNKKVLWVAIAVLIAGGVYYFGALKTPDQEAREVNEYTSLGDGTDVRVNTAKSALVGMWRSNEDPKFKRELKADGTATDSYDNEPSATQTGTWDVYAKESFDDGFAYLKMAIGEVILEFKIVKTTPETLELIYLDRGNTLTFRKL